MFSCGIFLATYLKCIANLHIKGEPTIYWQFQEDRKAILYSKFILTKAFLHDWKFQFHQLDLKNKAIPLYKQSYFLDQHTIPKDWQRESGKSWLPILSRKEYVVNGLLLSVCQKPEWDNWYMMDIVWKRN